MIPPHTQKRRRIRRSRDPQHTRMLCVASSRFLFPCSLPFSSQFTLEPTKVFQSPWHSPRGNPLQCPSQCEQKGTCKSIPRAAWRGRIFRSPSWQAVQTNTRAAPTYCLTKLGKVIAAEKRTWTEQAVVYYFKLPNNASDFCTPHCDRFSKVAAGLEENFLRYITFWSQPWSLKQLEWIPPLRTPHSCLKCKRSSFWGGTNKL